MEREERMAGLRTLRVQSGDGSGPSVVVLHGHAMTPEMLAPFAHSMGVAAEFFVPEAALEAVPSGRAWWPIDQERRTAMLASGPRDLSGEAPAGAVGARAQLGRLFEAVRAERPEAALAVIGFSQGGMLAMDALLRDAAPVNAMALLSSSRITAADWEARRGALTGLPVLVSHGRADPELSFEAGEALRDFCLRAGATVEWVPFDGGHEIPLVVWRAVRRFLRAVP